MYVYMNVCECVLLSLIIAASLHLVDFSHVIFVYVGVCIWVYVYVGGCMCVCVCKRVPGYSPNRSDINSSQKQAFSQIPGKCISNRQMDRLTLL